MQSQKRLGENDSRAQSYFEGHEMQMDRKRRFIILSDHTDNYILVFDKSGKLLDY